MLTRAQPDFSVVLLDDHPMIRYSFEVAANKRHDVACVASFSHSRELMYWLSFHHADVLVLDYMLDDGDLDGLSLIRQLRARYPALNILLCSSMESVAVIRSALLLGVKGYINKRVEMAALFDAIRVLATNKMWIPENISNALSQMPERKRRNLPPGQPKREKEDIEGLLTIRETEVLRFFLTGMTVMEIAEKLKRSRKTVSSHKRAGMRKLGIRSDPELFRNQTRLFK